MSLQIRTYIGGTQKYLELFDNEDIRLEMSFAEIQDISKKNSTFTRDFSVPGTKDNNLLFNYFYDMNSTPLDFIPTKKFDAELLYNGYELMTGYIRLNSVSVNNLEKTYNVSFYNDVGNLTANVGDKFLYDLDFSEINHPNDSFKIILGQIDNNLNITPNNYSYSNGKVFWGLYNIGYDYSSTFSGSGYENIVISGGNTDGKISYDDPKPRRITQNLNTPFKVGDYVRVNYYAVYGEDPEGWTEGIITSITYGNFRSLITFIPQYSLGTGDEQQNTMTKSIIPGGVINKKNYPLLSFSPNITSGNINDNTNASAGYFDYFDTPINLDYLLPSIQIKTLYDMICKQAGYTISSNFFDTAYFQKYYLPLKFFDTFYNSSTIPCYDFSGSSRNLFGDITSDINPQLGNTCSNIPFTATTSRLYLPTNYEGSITWEATFNVSGTTTCTGGPTDPYFRIQVGINDLSFTDVFESNVCFPIQRSITFTTNFDTNTFLTFDVAGNNTILYGISFRIVNATPYTPAYVDYKTFFPKNEYKQIDFISSVNKLFNLVVVPHQTKTNTLIVEPIVNYIGKGGVVDWTDKVDYSQPYSIKPITEYISGTLKLDLLKDNDYINEQYQKSNNRIFGSNLIQLNTEYKDKNIEISPAFSSPTDTNIGNTDYPYITTGALYQVKTTTNEQTAPQITYNPYKILPRIIFRGLVIPNKNYKPDVFWYGKLQGDSFNIQFSQFQNINRLTTYPYTYSGFSHYINWNADDKFDGNDINFPSQMDMYNVYYYDYISDLTSNENKIVNLKMIFSPHELIDIDFSKKIFINNTYFRINRISNFSLTEEGLVDVELIKLTKDYTEVPVKYYRLSSCTDSSVYYTNTNLNYHIYAYNNSYVKLYNPDETAIGCFYCEETEPLYDVDYNQVFIGTFKSQDTSGNLGSYPAPYTDCSCSARTKLTIFNDSF
jgi:hypothetical protein